MSISLVPIWKRTGIFGSPDHQRVIRKEKYEQSDLKNREIP